MDWQEQIKDIVNGQVKSEEENYWGHQVQAILTQISTPPEKREITDKEALKRVLGLLDVGYGTIREVLEKKGPMSKEDQSILMRELHNTVEVAAAIQKLGGLAIIFKSL